MQPWAFIHGVPVRAVALLSRVAGDWEGPSPACPAGLPRGGHAPNRTSDPSHKLHLTAPLAAVPSPPLDSLHLHLCHP